MFSLSCESQRNVWFSCETRQNLIETTSHTSVNHQLAIQQTVETLRLTVKHWIKPHRHNAQTKSTRIACIRNRWPNDSRHNKSRRFLAVLRGCSMTHGPNMCIYIYMYIHTYTHYIYIYMYTYVYSYMYLSLSLSLCVYICIYNTTDCYY